MPEMTWREARRIVLQMIKTREAEDASEYDKQCATALRVLLRRVGELEGVVRRVDEALDGCVSAMSGWTVEHLNGNEVIVVPGGERQFREDFDTAIDAQEMCKKALSAAVEEKS